MDSLLANYASSDDDENEEEQQEKKQKQREWEQTDYPSQPEPTSKFGGRSTSSIFSFLPPPKSSSLSPPKSNLPKPPQTLTNLSSPSSNNQDQQQEEYSKSGEQSSSSAVNFSYPAKPSSSLFSFLPEPKSSSIFSSLPPKTHQSDSQDLTNPAIPSSSLFSSLPQPKSSSISSSLPPPKIHQSDTQALPNLSSSSSGPNPKRVVQFRPPINLSLLKSRDDEDDDDDDEYEEKQRKGSKEFIQTSSVKSFLSSIPAPKNSVALGALPSSVGSGRRSIIEADVPASNNDGIRTENEVSVNSNFGSYEGQWIDGSSSNSLGTVSGSSEYTVGDGGGGDASYWGSANEDHVNYGGYENYGNYGHYESNWVDGPATTPTPDMSAIAESVMRVPGKRGRNEVPLEIVEVKQDELIKNRPRVDQAKLTGIAFGPSYQPVSTKGKPTKLHKRKHQIGSLYFDMRQKEMELAERRSKGFLTKAETQAKYGW
uniref:Putative proline-rich protein PRCC n=1 Tax=Davidia involucrata TaxID=16924 RepID=A0A5B6YR13_DAVIN